MSVVHSLRTAPYPILSALVGHGVWIQLEFDFEEDVGAIKD